MAEPSGFKLEGVEFREAWMEARGVGPPEFMVMFRTWELNVKKIVKKTRSDKGYHLVK